MANYIDGYVLPLPKKNVKAYRKLAQAAGRIWRKHGAVGFHESIGDDLRVKMGVPFTRAVKLKPGETVLFSWIVFKSRAHRDRVNAKVMKDPKFSSINPDPMPFDPRRMVYGGFKTLLES
jgi:uncharacterized protein YbaA (DUF1428 family)